jgi:hypothetical protein
MITSVDRTAREFHKRGQNDEERQRLVNEAQLLEVARHPGVVHCLGLEGDTLRLRLVDGEALSTRRPDNLLGVAVMAATTLADLHDIGVIHGAVTGDHILVDPAGVPVLCSLGYGHLRGTGAGAAKDAARRDHHGATGTEAAEDVVGLARAVLTAGGEELAGATRQVLLSAAVGGPRTPSARRLAGLMAAPPAAKPRRWQKLLAGQQFLPSKPRRLLVGGAVAVVVGLGVVAARSLPAARHRPASVASMCPPADLGCGPVTTSDGVVTTTKGRYRIGAPGEVIVVGRWTCAGPLPVLFEPATGEVWAWRGWATGKRPLAAVLVTRVAGGLTLRVGVGTSGCDFLQVLRSRGGSVAVHPWERA